jgi:quinol monooxygenase YgiN
VGEHQAPGTESRRQPASVVVVATITPQPEHARAVREAVLSAVPQVHAEEGCERHALHEARGGSLVVIEQWASPQTPAAHGRGEPFTELSRQLEGELAGTPELQVLSPVPTGDDAKGAL